MPVSRATTQEGCRVTSCFGGPRLALGWALALASLLAACSSGSEPPAIACTLEARAAIGVTVIDSVTKQPLAGATVTVVRAEGYTESVTMPDSSGMNQVGMAFERDGVYVVTVTRTGYRDWQAKDVVVTRDECHVQPVSLEAAMVPL